MNRRTGQKESPNHWILVLVDIKDSVFTIYDSTNYNVKILFGFVRRKLARLLNLLQDMTGTQVNDWNSVIIHCTKDVPKQAVEDQVNCSIFVWLMMELLIEDKLEIKHFPSSYKDMLNIRKRHLFNMKQFQVPRILFHPGE